VTEPFDPATLTEEERALPRYDDQGRLWYRKYGITFIPLYPIHLEYLRTNRNHPEIRQWMVMRDEITPEQQQAWFDSIDPAREEYSIIWNRWEQIGLTQLRNIDAAKGTAEGGIIIFKPEHQNGLLSHRAAIAGMDWNFLGRGLASLHVTVLKVNARARRLVRSLGYVLHDPDPAGEVLHGEVSAAAYFRAARAWRPVIRADADAEDAKRR
jgi:RimJ/RimL family protein N-acetyltransferase